MAAMSTLPPSPAPYQPNSYPLPPAVRQAVVITDIDMSIGALFRFTLKWFIAAIPAVIAFYLILFVFALALAAVFGGVFHSLHHALPQS